MNDDMELNKQDETAENEPQVLIKEEKSINPFPGLRPFRIDESHLFFGREGQSDEVLLKLSENRFVGIIGPSGSGKSSFVYCGVLPILYGGFLTEVSADWEVIVTRPGAGPIENLAEALLRTDKDYRESNIEQKKVKRTIISTLLRSSSLGLVEAIRQLKKSTNKNYLVLVDQFEELFRFKDSRDEGAMDETLAFINLMLEAVNYDDSPIYVALTMRSDFIGECAQFADLTKKINDSHYLIPQMTREQKKKAIEGPVAVGGATIASRLSQRLLNDLGDNPDQLPILQHSLMRTWDYWLKYRDQDEEAVDIKHYEAIGTMSEALSLHANEAYDELDEDQKLICESLFKAITEKRGENFGIRRPTRLGDIAAIAGTNVEAVAQVIEKFRAPGRSLLMPGPNVPLSAKSIIDISHESLMRIWVRLKNWVEDEADAVQMYLRLAEAASMYQLGKAGLWRPPDLQLALNWEAKHRPTLIWAQRYHPAFERTMEFLAHSKREYETEQKIKELQAKRRLKTARVTAMVMAGLCVVAIGFLLYAFDQSSEAKRQADIAKANADSAMRATLEANEQRAKADSASELAMTEAERAKLEQQKALEAKEEADSAAQEALRQEAIAREQTLEAEKQEGIANEKSKEALANAAEATKQAAIAKENAAEAKRSQYQSTAKAIALTSASMPETEAFYNLKGLLAEQAYSFNKEYKGYEYSTEIYNGLYFALKFYKNPLAKTERNVYNNVGEIFLATSLSRNIIYSVHQNGKLIAWRADGLDRRQTASTAPVTNFTVKGISLSPDDNFMVMGGNKNSIGHAEIVNLRDLGEKSVITGLGSGVIDVLYAPDGSIYLLDDNGYTIHLYKNGKLTKIITAVTKLTSMTITPDGRQLYASNQKGEVIEWKTRNNYSSETIYNSSNRISSISTSSSGDLLAFGDDQGTIKLRQGNSFSEIPSHTAPVTSIAFSSDGKFMATASMDETVRLWNLDDLTKPPIILSDHNDRVTSIAFTTDNNQLMASTGTRAVKFWPVKIEQMSDQICPKVNTNLTREDWNRFVGEDIDYEITCPNVISSTSEQ